MWFIGPWSLLHQPRHFSADRGNGSVYPAGCVCVSVCISVTLVCCD